MAPDVDQQRARYGHWRGNAFSSSWLLYAGYYLCRKDVKILQQLPGTNTDLGSIANLLVAFGLAYTIGHIIAGTLADTKGARRTALIGGLISSSSTVAMVLFHSHGAIFALQMFNGLGQGFGFPALAKLLSSWFSRKERSTVLAWWSSSYSLGGVVATGLATWCATTSLMFASNGWKRSYLLSSCLLAILSFYFYKTTEDDPKDAELPPLSKEEEQSHLGWRTVLQHKEVRAIAAMYFFLKMTRYALLFWLPLYLVQTVHYSDSLAGSTSALFELFGFVGAVLATSLSNRYFQERRYPVAAIMLFALGFMSLMEPPVSTMGWWASAASISFMGILIYGPDALMVSTAVLESVPYGVSGRAIAFVNGVGSIGQMFSPYLVTRFAHHYGWDNLFNLLLVTSLASAGIMARYWNYNGTHSASGSLTPIAIPGEAA